MTSPMLSFDPEANAVYLRFSDREVAETIEFSRWAYMDVDADGTPVGLEILNADPALLAELNSMPDGLTLQDFVKRHAA
jgi:uncharacterized protein YuzE